MAGTAPELIIRDHLYANGGEARATLRHLLDTFQVEEADALGRERIRLHLASAGIDSTPPLDGLGGEDSLLLILASSRGFLAG